MTIIMSLNIQHTLLKATRVLACDWGTWYYFQIFHSDGRLATYIWLDTLKIFFLIQPFFTDCAVGSILGGRDRSVDRADAVPCHSGLTADWGGKQGWAGSSAGDKIWQEETFRYLGRKSCCLKGPSLISYLQPESTPNLTCWRFNTQHDGVWTWSLRQGSRGALEVMAPSAKKEESYLETESAE